MRYCRRCILPDSRPNLTIERDGACNACHAFDMRWEIDWAGRMETFRQVIAHARSRNRSYDCVIPVSGGKDSTWQVVKCLEFGLHPLTVTWRTPARTVIGQQNLENLIALGVDHIDYQISPKVEARFMLRAFETYGSTAIPMHLALFAIPLQIAARFRIPLVVWGENAAFEYGGTEEERTGFRLDSRWLRRFGVTHGTTAADWVAPDLTEKDLAAYFAPGDAELEQAGVNAVFLGYYLPWDPRQSLSVATAHGFRSRPEGPKTGTYDFADIDDDFISLHHYLKWYKFGFTRAFDNLSLEIRHGRMSREEAIAVLRTQGDDTPHDDIRRFCEFAGIPASRFFEIAERFRDHSIWKKEEGVWRIPGFLIEDWPWQAS